MKIKMFEVRDRATFIPVIAIKLDDDCTMEEDYLLARSGYGSKYRKDYTLLTRIADGETKCSYDEYSWGCRTMLNAHKFIDDNFDTLTTGAVVDVEYILGETNTPRVSERISG